MADPIVEIEVELKRAVVSESDENDQRKKLKKNFLLLTPDQAATLLTRILTWDGSRLSQDFRRPDRNIRLELLLVLVQRLGTQTAADFFLRLKGDAKHAPDPKLSQGLRMVFPDYTKTERDKFLKALKENKPPSGAPTVLLEFRNSGKFSTDNQAKELGFRNEDEPDDREVLMKLGPSSVIGTNKMEIRGTIIGHRPDAEYKFGRTIEQKSWYLVRKDWKVAGTPLPAGTDDNKTTTDEDDVPENDHIYSIDAPGYVGNPAKKDFVAKVSSELRDMVKANVIANDVTEKDVTEYVYMMNAIETVDVRVGSQPWTRSNQLSWFSVSWFEKSNGSWRRKDGMNAIRQGSIDNLSDATEPPTSF